MCDTEIRQPDLAETSQREVLFPQEPEDDYEPTIVRGRE
jgi:hypothetical protein